MISTAVLMVLLAGTAPPASDDAPADEYFGHYGMSALSLRTRLDTLARRYHERSISDVDLVHDADLIGASLRAWRERYPRDTWLPPTAFRLEQLYQAVQTEASRERAREMLTFVVRYFGSTRYARVGRRRLAQGFPPLQTEPPAHATPNPYARRAGRVPAASDPSVSLCMNPRRVGKV